MLLFHLEKDKQLKRQITLLKEFNRAGQVVSVGELASKLNVSRATVKSDIESINSNSTCHIFLKSNFREGIELTFLKYTSIETEIVNLAKNSLVFQIIDEISAGKPIDFNSCCLKFFISDIALTRLIKHMNTTLKEYEIKITTAQIDFVGKEENIRFFLYVFYKDFNDYFVSVTENPSIINSYNTLMEIRQKEKRLNLLFSHFTSSIWITIAKKRVARERFVELLPQPIFSSLKESADFLEFKPLYDLLVSPEQQTVSIPEDECLWGYICSLHCIVYTKIPQTTNKKYVFHREINKKINNDIKCYISKLNNYLELELSEENQHLLFSYLLNISLLSFITPLYQKNSIQLQNYVKENFTEKYETCLTYLKSNPINWLEEVYPIDIAITLTLLLSAMISNKEKHKKILFSFQGEPGIANYLMYHSQSILKDNLKAVYNVDQILTKEIIKEIGACLLVCNYDYPEVEQLGIPFTRLSYLPTEKEWSELNNLIKIIL